MWSKEEAIKHSVECQAEILFRALEYDYENHEISGQDVNELITDLINHGPAIATKLQEKLEAWKDKKVDFDSMCPHCWREMLQGKCVREPDGQVVPTAEICPNCDYEKPL